MNSRGVILIVTLWILAILVTFVLGLGFRMSLETRLTDYNIESFKLFYIAKAAVNSLIAKLGKDGSLNYDSLNEDWSNNEEFFKDIVLGDQSFTISYIRQEGNLGKMFYGAMDETSRININAAPREILLNLPGVTEDIADSILDWRDVDDISHADGAENAYYMSLEPSYSCKNESFQSKEELLLVKGMTPEVLSNIKDMITIYGEEGKVNLNTANSNVMEALGLDNVLIDGIIRYRAGSDEEEGTDDDNIFRNVGEIINLVNSLNLNPEEKQKVNNLHSAGLIGISSNHFRAYVTSKTKNGRMVKIVEAVVSRSAEKGKVVFWHEY